jgi:hypothetical protein
VVKQATCPFVYFTVQHNKSLTVAGCCDLDFFTKYLSQSNNYPNLSALIFFYCRKQSYWLALSTNSWTNTYQNWRNNYMVHYSSTVVIVGLGACTSNKKWIFCGSNTDKFSVHLQYIIKIQKVKSLAIANEVNGPSKLYMQLRKRMLE